MRSILRWNVFEHQHRLDAFAGRDDVGRYPETDAVAAQSGGRGSASGAFAELRGSSQVLCMAVIAPSFLVTAASREGQLSRRACSVAQ
jgi:hypothetical protein